MLALEGVVGYIVIVDLAISKDVGRKDMVEKILPIGSGAEVIVLSEYSTGSVQRIVGSVDSKKVCQTI